MITAIRPYKIYAIDPRTLRVSVTVAKLCDLKKDADEIEDYPIAYAYEGEEVIVAGVAKHDNGEQYYLPNLDRAEGYNTNDFKKHFEFIGDRVLNEEEHEPKYGPEAIFPPVQAPNKADTVHVSHTIPAYDSLSDAYVKRPSRANFKPGNYFVYKRLSGMLHLTATAGVPTGFWANPDDMHEKDWRELADIWDEPKYYQALQTAKVIDLEGDLPDVRSVTIRQPILIAGTVVSPNGLDYYLPEPTYAKGQWYGIRKRCLKPIPDYKPFVKSPEEPIVVITEMPTFRDRLRSIVLMFINKEKKS